MNETEENCYSTIKETAEISAKLEEERTILTEFLKLLEMAGKNINFQFRSGKGQLGAEKKEYSVSTSSPKVYMGGTAWIGLELDGELYRTETIKCRDRFVAWVKEIMELLGQQISLTDQTFDLIFVPEETCFVPVMKLTFK